jgi:peptide/nickel transport system substrate-binding protein
MVRRRVWCTALLTFALVAATATTAVGGAPARVRHDTKAILRVSADLAGFGAIVLDPHQDRGGPSGWYQRLIYDSLIRDGAGGSDVPGLATSWTFPDDRTIELKLRRGVKFHDGTRFDAEAVKFSLERSLATHNPTQTDAFRALESVEVVDQYTVRLHLSAPLTGAWIENLKGGLASVVSPAAAKKYGDDFQNHPIGAGPYVFDKAVPEEIVSVRKFKDHWEKDKWQLAGIDFIHLSQEGPAMANALFAGSIDMIPSVTPTGLADFANRGGIKTVSQGTTTAYTFVMCATKPPFDSVKVRQAVAHALNRDDINKAALHGGGVVGDQYFPPGSQFNFPDLDGQFSFDLKVAKKLMKEAGVKEGFTFKLMVPAVPPYTTVAEVMQAQLEKIGIKAEILQSNDIVEQVFNQKVVDATMLPLKSDEVQYFLLPGGIGNWCDYKNPTVKKAFDRTQDATLPQAERQQAWRDLNEAVRADLPEIQLLFEPVGAAFADKVGGVKHLIQPRGGPDFSTVYVKK